MTKTRFDVLVIGSPCVDLVFSGLPNWPVLGQEIYVPRFAVSVGGTFNTAAGLSRLGMRVGILCELGDDFLSRYILEELERAGISRELVFVRDYPLRNVSVCLPYEGERGFISYSDATASSATRSLSAEQHAGSESTIYSFAADMLVALDTTVCDALFLYAHPALLPTLERFHRRGTRIFLDVGWSPSNLNHSCLAPLVRLGHYFMPNQIEASAITGRHDPEAAACALAQLGPLAIVKVGASGVVACHDGNIIYCSPPPVKDVVDTTGAGDAFDAGFIYGTLRGYPLLDALYCGTICGSLATTALTGTAAAPTAEELERLRSQLI